MSWPLAPVSSLKEKLYVYLKINYNHFFPQKQTIICLSIKKAITQQLVHFHFISMNFVVGFIGNEVFSKSTTFNFLVQNAKKKEFLKPGPFEGHRSQQTSQ